ncbi:LuxR family transcriptional regulator (plasmid) [Rhizobium rhizogenes]|nr:LuxR family transcriptional regulator [Rhizobium rhizogenes]NTI85217.1 LuxR family transcriptional regulator [Rhizobium rhizogenes]NTJ27403.1 LuxR family transcriptional regulator [Rhizobium rhizogenes]QUE84684.1 LuxR family transcriptional regulator [Rhizobium rhizogenes]TQO74120.1 LuxR family transcriptional regulator [Rhizobium rhizogenes]
MESWMLSPMERTSLRWVSRGKTLDEIALLERKGVANIEHYLARAIVALKARSIEDAHVKADISASE